MYKRAYDIAVILSVTTGVTLSEDMDEFLEFMTGVKFASRHQWGKATDECIPALVAQHPWLADVDASTLTEENWQEWLGNQIRLHGPFHVVEPLPTGTHVPDTPFGLLLREFGPDAWRVKSLFEKNNT